MRVKKSRQSQAARTVGLLLVLCAGVGGAGWLFFSPPGNALRQAGSTSMVEPIAPLRLVSAMKPSSPDDAREFNGAELISYTDSEIQVAVAMKLEEMNLPVEPLDIRVDDRQVRLDGRVADALLRDAIEITVRSVPGVRTVDNRLEVVTPPQ